jgi:hypothetical protein
LSRRPLEPDGLAYWVRARAPFGHVPHLALNAPESGWTCWLRTALPEGERITFQDPAACVYRAGCTTASWRPSCSSGATRHLRGRHLRLTGQSQSREAGVALLAGRARSCDIDD